MVSRIEERSGEPGARLRAWLRSHWSWLAALGVGAALRLDQISLQIPADDELHAVHAAVLHGPGWIATHFGDSDHSIPLALLYEWMAGTGGGLTELRMRAPMVVVGLLTPLVLPLLLPGRLGSREVRHAFAWLLALSPLHLYFSRYARPYGLAMVATFAALLAFQRWWTGAGRRWGAAYAGCAILGPWLHPTVLPVTLAPLLVALVRELVPGRGRTVRAWQRAAGMACVVAVGLVALLALPLLESWSSIAGKLGVDAEQPAPAWETFLGAVRLFAGTGHLWLAAGLAAVAVLGAVRSAREEGALVASLGFAVTFQALALGAAHPDEIEIPIVLARYCLPFLPILLLFEARGFVVLGDALTRSTRLPRALPLGVGCALLLGLGPLHAVHYRPNNWANHALFQYEYDPVAPFSYAGLVRPARIPRFYEELGRLPAGSVLVVEAPWDSPWDQNPFPYYQRVHRQAMKVGLVADRRGGVQFGLSESEGFRFAQFVSLLDDERLRREGVAYVVFHKDLWAETPSTRPGPMLNVLAWIERYRRRYGPPSYEDDWLVVFDLQR